MNILKTIYNLNEEDVIFADLEVNGRQIATLKSIHFSSIDEVVRAILSMAGEYIGLAKLSIRNKSQGWNMIMGVAHHRKISSNGMLSPKIIPLLRPSNGLQLSIPWK